MSAKESAAVQASSPASTRETAEPPMTRAAPSAPLSARTPDFRDWPQREDTDGDWFSCGLPFRIGQ